MRKFGALFLLIFGFIIFWNGESASQELTCKDQKVLLDITTPRDDSSKNLLAAVLIRDADEKNNKEGLRLEKYLHRWWDGWTHLSTEGARVKPGQKMSNCLPQEVYDVKVEYYERRAFIVDWLLYFYEFKA